MGDQANLPVSSTISFCYRRWSCATKLGSISTSELYKIRRFNLCIALGFSEKVKTLQALKGCVLQMFTLVSTKHPLCRSCLSQDYLKHPRGTSPVTPVQLV